MTRLIGGYASACLILEVLQEKTRPTRATPNKRIRKVFHSGFTVKHKCGYCYHTAEYTSCGDECKEVDDDVQGNESKDREAQRNQGR